MRLSRSAVVGASAAVVAAAVAAFAPSNASLAVSNAQAVTAVPAPYELRSPFPGMSSLTRTG